MGSKFGSEKQYLTQGVRSLGYKVFGEIHLGSVARADILFRKLKGILPSKQRHNGYRVLDAGCGKGAFSFHLARKLPDITISGFDLDPEVVAGNIKLLETLGLENVTFFQGNLENLETDGLYDLIISVDVFEHVEKDVAGFRNLRDVLVEGGYLLVHVPKQAARHALRGAGGDPVLSLEEKEDYRVYHERQGYEPEELAEKLQKAGFNEVVVHQTVGFIGKIAYDIFFKLIIGQKRLKTLNLMVFAVLFPFLRLMIWVDAQFQTSDGLGLLAISRK